MGDLAKARFGGLFATPVLEHAWADGPELNTHLRDSILAHARQHAGNERTNVGGWHSDTGLLEFCGNAGERLVRHMRDMADEATRRLYGQYGMSPAPLTWIVNAWANVNRHGDFNTQHIHPGATWSGVYYVDDGQSSPDAEGTAIHLSDPCPTRAGMFFPEIPNSTFLFWPEPCLMILCPSYVPHAVPPHQGERPRISIAFNVRKEPFP